MGKGGGGVDQGGRGGGGRMMMDGVDVSQASGSVSVLILITCIAVVV